MFSESRVKSKAGQAVSKQLRHHDDDLRPIWFEHQGRLRALRKSIKNRECNCPMANASYANMLLHVPTMAKVSKDVVMRGR